eukprot:9494-Eustigmatos_ZCMA.PRE.1
MSQLMLAASVSRDVAAKGEAPEPIGREQDLRAQREHLLRMWEEGRGGRYMKERDDSCEGICGG